MRRSMSVGLPVALAIVSSAFLFAQQPAPAQGGRQGRGGGGGGAAAGAGGNGAARASLAAPIFKVEWIQPQGQTGQVPIVQGNVADPNVEVHWYGDAAKHLLTSGTVGSETTPFTVWSGECDGPFAITYVNPNDDPRKKTTTATTK